MAPGQERAIGPDDLERAIRSVAEHFKTDIVVIVGSQALLVGRDDVMRRLRTSVEIDAYPSNRAEWEKQNPGEEASETINGLFGEGSLFHATHGFFIDGVDEHTAILPDDWMTRAVTRSVAVGDRMVKAIAPEPNDLVAAKLVRGDPKDIEFARLCFQSGLARHDEVKSRLESIMPAATLEIALGRLRQARHGADTSKHD